MKASISQENKDFQPIKVEIILESIEEVATFAAQINCSTRTLQEQYPLQRNKSLCSTIFSMNLWNNVGKELIKKIESKIIL